MMIPLHACYSKIEELSRSMQITIIFRYEDELAMSAIKREAVTLYEQLRVVEMKRNELLIEEQERGTPGQV